MNLTDTAGNSNLVNIGLEIVETLDEPEEETTEEASKNETEQDLEDLPEAANEETTTSSFNAGFTFEWDWENQEEEIVEEIPPPKALIADFNSYGELVLEFNRDMLKLVSDKDEEDQEEEAELDN